MSENLQSSTQQARQFLEAHVYAPHDYDEYVAKQVATWQACAAAAEQSDEPIKPLWLRRNGDDTTEFAAHIDYWMPVSNTLRLYASIDINTDGGQSEVETWLPKPDGSGEPIVAFREAYTLQALGRAILVAEAGTRS